MPLSSPSTSGALVELRNVHFGYGERPVLRGLSLTVPRGHAHFVVRRDGYRPVITPSVEL